MKIKSKVDVSEFESMPSEIKQFYSIVDDQAVLQIEGGNSSEDFGKLKRAKDREVELRKEIEADLDKVSDELKTLKKTNPKVDDVARLERSFESKMKRLEEKHAQELESLSAKTKSYQEFISKQGAESLQSIASELAEDNAKILMPHLKNRFKFDFEGDVPTQVILDAEGNVSEMTIDELKQEFRDSKDFSAIIVGSKSSGSGASSTTTKVDSGAGTSSELPASQMSVSDLRARIEAKKQAQE